MKKLLGKILFVAGLSLPLAAMAGCSYQAGLAMDSNDHARQVARFASLEERQVVEDWDYFLLQDEPSKLTPYYMPDRE